jgi:putative serine protease PepD
MTAERILILANEAVAGGEPVPGALRSRLSAASEVRVVAPIRPTRLQSWLSDTDAAAAAARERMSATVEAVRGYGQGAVAGAVGDEDPLQAIADELVTFRADAVIVAIRSDDDRRRVGEQVRTRFGLAVTRQLLEGDGPSRDSDDVDLPATRGRSVRRSARRLAGAIGLLVALLPVACAAGEESSEPGRGTSGAQSAPAEQRNASPAAPSGRLLARLRVGGLVLMFRHADTDRSHEDDPRVDLDDCSTQRNLSDAGRADARAIGAALRALRIPVGSVWASPYCRARQTARLAFGRTEIVHGLERLYPTLDVQADRRLNRLIRERAPAPGQPNLVIAAHGVYPSVLRPAVALEEGEAAIYAVHRNRVELLGRVLPDAWRALAPARSNAGADPLRRVGERVQRSVVSIEPDARRPAGAGFRVAVDGIVVTSAQVVANADAVTVVLADGRRRPARVLGRAPAVGVAVLELDDDSGLPPLHSGSGLATARVGDPVLAIGPRRGRAAGVTAGTLTALERRVRLRSGGQLEVLTIDAPLSRAAEGAPLVNAEGEVLGVTSAALLGGRGAIAIPVDVARSASLAIVERRRR